MKTMATDAQQRPGFPMRRALAQELFEEEIRKVGQARPTLRCQEGATRSRS